MQRDKITVTQIPRTLLYDLRDVVKWKTVQVNNLLASQNTYEGYIEIIYSIGIHLWYNLNARLNKRYPPNQYRLTLELHDARFIYNAILEYQKSHGLDAQLDKFKNAVHSQLPVHYESIQLSKDTQHLPPHRQETNREPGTITSLSIGPMAPH
ncbi:hypothetical protein [Nonlabens agnitus]|uniref:Uncharacterized protein n=1 Tax=Nonlabens agnitus TaxID=870484 RepID=A0A2S9WXC4_9FLAO|nr:hypothetical protein [Nonlabens agnitus]PRP68119.1 hypothetical protein BST86_13990 [Nonlabens agnitus]